MPDQYKYTKLPTQPIIVTNLTKLFNFLSLLIKTADQTWLRLTQVIIIVYYTTVDRYSTDNQCLTYRPSVDQSPLGRYVGQHIDQHISVNISVECQSIRQLTYRSSIGRYVDRYIGRVSVDILTDTSVKGCTKYT